MKEAEDMKAKMAEMKDGMKEKEDSLDGRADALTEQIDSLKAELEEAKRVDVDSLVAGRVAWLEKARVALDAEYAFAGKSDREVMVDSIKLFAVTPWT